MRRLVLLLFLCTLLTIGLAGCGSNTTIKNAPYTNAELVDIEGRDLSNAKAERLYEAGHEHLVAGDPKQALRIYKAVQRRYPFSRYATQAALETATAYYMLEKYAKTVSAADRFIKQHPRHPNVDYLYYLRGLANFHRNQPSLLARILPGSNQGYRNLSFLRQAFSDFKLLIRNYPDSVYAKDAQMHMIEIRNRLANFELTVAEYYLERGAYVAAARRASYIVRHYQRSTAIPRALEIMHQSYIQLGLPALARDARAILQASFSDYIVHRERFYRKRAEELEQFDDSPLEWAMPWEDAEEDDGPDALRRYKEMQRPGNQYGRPPSAVEHDTASVKQAQDSSPSDGGQQQPGSQDSETSGGDLPDDVDLPASESHGALERYREMQRPGDQVP